MRAHHLGHVLLYVRDLERSLAFYRDLIGFNEVSRTLGGRAVALGAGRARQEIVLVASSPFPSGGSGRPRRVHHLGIKIGESLDELRAALRELQRAGVRIDAKADHGGKQSLYVRDPDGNEVELYVDDVEGEATRGAAPPLVAARVLLL